MNEGNQQVMRTLLKPSDSSTEWYIDSEPMFSRIPDASNCGVYVCS